MHQDEKNYLNEIKKTRDLFRVNPYLQIKNADGSHAMWVPSIGDLMAEDWEVIN
mgnify:CR=1 FL=1